MKNKVNVFAEKPEEFLEYLNSIKIQKENRKEFKGKSFFCVMLTALCSASCEGCFWKSSNIRNTDLYEKDQFSASGSNSLVKFLNDSNNGYLLISGGGEPMNRKDLVNKIIREVQSKYVVLVTNGMWGATEASAEKVLDELYQSYLDRADKEMKFVLRLSVDSLHYSGVGFGPIMNIIKVFQQKYKDIDGYELRIHTMQNDATLENLAEKMGGKLLYSSIENQSDNDILIKRMRNQAVLQLEDFNIPVVIAKLFYADLRRDLTKNRDKISKSLKIYDEDIQDSENGNPSVSYNTDNTEGIDVVIFPNGNIYLWDGQIKNPYNIYINSFDEFLEESLSNIFSYSSLVKGWKYKEEIINKVNPLAVLRTKAIGIRDFSNLILLEEAKTRLFYGIIVVKDFLRENILSEKDVSHLPSALLETIKLSDEEIIKLYEESDYDIISEYLNRDKIHHIKQLEWDALFSLIKLGHYNVKQNHIKEALDYYNKKFNQNIKSIDQFDENKIPYRVFIDRLAPMNSQAQEQLSQRNKEIIKQLLDSKENRK